MIQNELRKNFYFTIEASIESDVYDSDDNEYWGDEDNQYICNLINSANYIYMCSACVSLTQEKLQTMVSNSILNIIKRKSTIFDYSEYEEDYEIEGYDISEDDIMLELQELYDMETGRSICPLIWGNDVWDGDSSYNEENPAEFWRVYLHYEN